MVGIDQSRILRSHEGLTLETSALSPLYGGQFTSSTKLIDQFILQSPADACSTKVYSETYPFNHRIRNAFYLGKKARLTF